MKKNIISFLLILLLSLVAIAFSACGDGDATDGWTVTYTDGKGEIKTVTVQNGESVSLEPAEKVGYVFEGFYTAEGLKCFGADGTVVSGLQITADLTVYPRYTPFEYSFVFDAQVGVFEDGSDTKSIAVSYGEDITNAFPVPVSPVAKYEFDGWFNEDGSVRYSNGGVPVGENADKTAYPLGENGSTFRLYARFKVKTFSVTLDYADGETLPVKLTVEYGLDFSFLSDYGKDNGSSYVKKWSTEADGYYILPNTVTKDMRIYAVWQKYINVNFVYSDTITKTFKVDTAPGMMSVLPETAELPGYAFCGWYSNKLYTGLPITQVYYGELSDIYYAKWEKVEYTLNFVTNSWETVQPITYFYGDTTALPVVAKSGYRFIGWSETERGGKCFYNIPSDLYGNKTLYANWVSNKFSVELDANGGSISSEFVTLEYGKTTTIPVPTKDRYAFAGWYIDDIKCTDGEGNIIDSVWTILEGSKLTARWTERKYTVRYETNGGSLLASQEYYYGITLRFPNDPKKNGLQFRSWYDETLTTEYDCTVAVTADMVLYAKWIDSTPISSAEDFKNIKNAPGGNYHLTCDINMYGEALTPIPEFKGVLNGNGYKIYNFVINVSIADAYATSDSLLRVGLFATNSGVIKNLIIDNCNLMASYTNIETTNRDQGYSIPSPSLGILVGYNTGTVEGCSIRNSTLICNNTVGTNTSKACSAYLYPNIGGLVGYSIGKILLNEVENSKISVEGALNINGSTSAGGTQYKVGGICGSANSIVYGCVFKGEINTTTSGGGKLASNLWDTKAWAIIHIYSGGIVGAISNNCTVNECESYAAITVSTDTNYTGSNTGKQYHWIGGICGYGQGSVSKCIYDGDIISSVAQTNTVGGIVGGIGCDVNDCVSMANIQILKGLDVCVGGIYGNADKTIKNSYFMGTISSNVAGYIGGITGQQTGSVITCLNLGTISAASGDKVGYIVGVNEGISTGNRYSDEAVITVNGSKYTPAESNGASKATASDVRTEDFYLNVIYWHPDTWYFEDGKLPTLKWIKWQEEQKNN